MAQLDERGHEILDPTPIAIPVGLKRPPTLQETIKQLIRTEMSQRAAMEGQETFEEADDLDIGEDFDPTSPWELNFDQESAPRNPKGFQEENPNVRQSKESVGDRSGPDRKGQGTASNDRHSEVKARASDKDD